MWHDDENFQEIIDDSLPLEMRDDEDKVATAIGYEEESEEKRDETTPTITDKREDAAAENCEDADVEVSPSYAIC